MFSTDLLRERLPRLSPLRSQRAAQALVQLQVPRRNFPRPACSSNFDSGTVVSLTATPDSSSTFAGWGGACSGTAACSVTTDAAKSLSANFTANPGPITLTVAKSGAGTGTVTSTPSGISCGRHVRRASPTAQS